jgi:hypothetical protein
VSRAGGVCWGVCIAERRAHTLPLPGCGAHNTAHACATQLRPHTAACDCKPADGVRLHAHMPAGVAAAAQRAPPSSSPSTSAQAAAPRELYRTTAVACRAASASGGAAAPSPDLVTRIKEDMKACVCVRGAVCVGPTALRPQCTSRDACECVFAWPALRHATRQAWRAPRHARDTPAPQPRCV